MYRHFKPICAVIFLLFVGFLSCKDSPKKNDLITDASQMDVSVKANIENMIFSAGKDESLPDSTSLLYYDVLKFVYDQNKHLAFWSNHEKFNNNATNLLNFIDTCVRSGLYKEDYHYDELKRLTNLVETDSLKKMDEEKKKNHLNNATDFLKTLDQN